MQHHFHAGRDVVGDQRGHADAQVDVLPVAELPGHPGGQFVAGPALGFLVGAFRMPDGGTPVFGPDGFGAGRRSLRAVGLHGYAPACSVALPVPAGVCQGHGPLFDPFLTGGDNHHPLDEDARGVDVFRVQFARFHEFLHLGDGDPARHGAERVEVHGGGVEDEVAVAVALPGVDQAVVGCQRFLQDVVNPVESPHFLGCGGDGNAAVGVVLLRQAAVGHLRAHAGLGVEGGDPGAAGPEFLGEGSLRGQHHLQFTGEVLARELLVFADVGADGPPDPAVAEQDAQAPVVHAAVVAHGLQVLGAVPVQGVDQGHRDSAQAEPSHREGRAVGDVRYGFLGAGNNLVDHRWSFQVSTGSTTV